MGEEIVEGETGTSLKALGSHQLVYLRHSDPEDGLVQGCFQDGGQVLADDEANWDFQIAGRYRHEGGVHEQGAF